MIKSAKQRYERYDLSDSPWVQRLTQRDLAALLGTTKGRLETLVEKHESYISRRSEEINGKIRKLAIPVRQLRGVHERLKYHLNKIKQPVYLYSPRKGRSQRNNAAVHSSKIQVLKIDIRQFYPSTTQEDIFRWAHHSARMSADVAGLFTKLIAVDRRMPFGSPVSPVLTSLIHRPMFDRVFHLCEAEGLLMTLWVDDLTISGQQISGKFMESVRAAIREGGFQTHKIKFLNTFRPVKITGVPIVLNRVLAPNSLHEQIKTEYEGLRGAKSDLAQIESIERLLSALGNYRYHVGAKTSEGRKAANRMHALKQRRRKLDVGTTTMPAQMEIGQQITPLTSSEVPWG